MFTRPDPKPQKREKKKGKGLRAKRWGVKRKARGTAHSRRERGWGRMAWLHSLEMCFVWGFFATQWLLESSDPDERRAAAIQIQLAGGVRGCGGEFQVMHLDGRIRDPHDERTALGCRDHHGDVDQTRAWFRRLSRDDRAWLKVFMAARATTAWLALSPEERARWDATARQE